MDSERILLEMYKDKQYKLTNNNIQALVKLFSIAGILAGAILTLALVSNFISFYMFISVLFCIGITILLEKLKIISRNTATLIYFIYICFLFIPANWIVADGISGATPYIAVIVMLAVMLVFTGKTQGIFIIAYLSVILAVTVYSIILVYDKTDGMEYIYKAAAFIIAAFFIAYYMRFMFKKYDEMHNKFLSGTIKDELTQVLNRNVLSEVIDYMESIYKTRKQSYVFAMLDVDNFKKINDEYGHVVGDIVLRNTAKCIKKNIREEDFIIRYGGDEFLIIFTDSNILKAEKIIGRIGTEQNCSRLLGLNISVSCGCAERNECSGSAELLKLSDKRMYENKAAKKQSVN